MKVAFDAQILYEQEKTGVGQCAKYILDNIRTKCEIEYYLNIKKKISNEGNYELIRKY